MHNPPSPNTERMLLAGQAMAWMLVQLCPPQDDQALCLIQILTAEWADAITTKPDNRQKD